MPKKYINSLINAEIDLSVIKDEFCKDLISKLIKRNPEDRIDIEDIFSQTIETDDYKVFIQECGDGKLYVEKKDTYFEVKGTPNLEFDWELKAIQKGYKNVRLEEYKERESDN